MENKYKREPIIDKIDANDNAIKITPINSTTINSINSRVLMDIKSRIIREDNNESEIYKSLIKKFK